MDKELKNNNQLILTGMNEIVREIIENTGLIGWFSQTFGKNYNKNQPQWKHCLKRLDFHGFKEASQ